MAVEEKSVKILEEAFSQFNATSLELEQSYGLLKEEVLQLKEKLRKTQQEKEELRNIAERNHRLAAVGEMAARMAHELRNPLGSIELFSALLQKEMLKNTQDPTKLEWGKHLSSAVKTMDHTITNLLLFTRKPKLQCRKVDLKNLMTEVLHFVEHLLKQNKIEIFENTDRHLKPFYCDEDLLKQVVLNLVLNAIDAMPQGGALKTSILATESGIAMTISDTGIGISEAHLHQIFDPFFTTKKTGTGLGLAIAQNAISAHQGVIHVRQRADRGTSFSIQLPKQVEAT